MENIAVEAADGGEWVGYYEQGKKEGSWSFYKDGALLKTVRYAKGGRQGRGYLFDAEGNLLLSLEFDQDRIHGQAKFFSRAGEHIATYKYVYDKLDRVEFFLLHAESPPKTKPFFRIFDLSNTP